MTKFIRVDRMEKVCLDQDYTWHMDGKRSPVWTQDFYEWYASNPGIIKQVHTDKHYETMQNMITLEFHDADEAIIFAMRFA